MIYIGIDPGKHGAVAVINETDNIIEVFDLEFDVQKIHNIIRSATRYYDTEYSWMSYKAAIEQVHSMPRDGKKGAFTFGYMCGLIEGALASYAIPYEFVTPQKWKKEMLGKGKKTKEDSLNLAKELFPSADLHLKKHHNRAEALLIAEWLRRNNEK